MTKKKPWIVRDRDITPESAWLDRRSALKAMAAAGLLPAYLGQDPGPRPGSGSNDMLFKAPEGTYPAEHNENYKVEERELTSEEAATHYNNFYEFSLNKQAVANLVGKFKTEPWKVEIAGLVEKPGTADLEDFFKNLSSEERIYRFRCVEAWAMTVPWTGFPMKQFLEWVKPKPEAKYVRMVTFHRPHEAPNQTPAAGYPWPYYEALTIEEAANEMSMLVHGLYGKELPRQNGAPLRLIVPWKYGLKNIKSIVRFEFTADRPPALWNDVAGHEYSWHSNVEPDVPHPRWSQASERLIPDGERVLTKLYNGYADQVAHLYKR